VNLGVNGIINKLIEFTVYSGQFTGRSLQSTVCSLQMTRSELRYLFSYGCPVSADEETSSSVEIQVTSEVFTPTINTTILTGSHFWINGNLGGFNLG